MQLNIEIAENDANWQIIADINAELIREVLAYVMQRFPAFHVIKVIELSILLTNDQEITELNNKFRHKNSPTNVLSFPDQEINWQEINNLMLDKDSDYFFLGDIAFSYNTIFQEAIEQGKSFKNHFIHLLAHSILHLLGFDHLTDSDAEAMEKLEIAILADLSITSPY